ncbi:Hypothetical predicted protein [Olea europaea subsp. europaea]|uniref:Uncharacterized protein n=1 Tax=Olea europaea subsp. europaea TaxID=158383 RepID=A0A8S0QKJ7_OLEEU|nr:Hypothetical predicted protein [Olea europaea subsp. europaea]
MLEMLLVYILIEHAKTFGNGVVDHFVGHGIGTVFHSQPLIFHHWYYYTSLRASCALLASLNLLALMVKEEVDSTLAEYMINMKQSCGKDTQHNESRIREARSESFVVRDYQGEYPWDCYVH